MSRKSLFLLWGSLFVLSAGLGFLQPVTGIFQGALLILSIAFFLPPACLLYQGNANDQILIRTLAALSLGLTLGLLILSLITAMGSETLGAILHAVLTIVSAPMVCSGYWAVSLFLWACLLVGSFKTR